MKIIDMRLLLVVFLLCFVDLHAQQPAKIVLAKANKDTVLLTLDSSKTIVKSFDNQTIQKYKAQTEFQYGDEEPKGLSWWDRFWRNFWAWVNRLFSGGKPSAGFSIWPVIFKYTVIAIFIGLIIFVIFKFAGIDLKWFTKKSTAVDIPYDESLENIHEINFDDEIDMALQHSNYRLAVRLLYLQTLKHLSDKDLIDWLPNKTNLAYVREAKLADGKDAFAHLTHQFEYIWYGDFPVDKAGFAQIQQSFQQFNSKWK